MSTRGHEHRRNTVILSAWVDPVVRDYAREAARVARLPFSTWVERAVRQAVARESSDMAIDANYRAAIELAEADRDAAIRERDEAAARASRWKRLASTLRKSALGWQVQAMATNKDLDAARAALRELLAAHDGWACDFDPYSRDTRVMVEAVDAARKVLR